MPYKVKGTGRTWSVLDGDRVVEGGFFSRDAAEDALKATSYAFRDPATKDAEVWRVSYRGGLCSPEWNSKGAAEAYIDILDRGTRTPEYLP